MKWVATVHILSRLKTIVPGSKIVARDENSALRFDELMQLCEQLSNSLKAHHIERLALHADNSIHWMVVDLACQLASVCLIPLPTFFTPQQLKNVMSSTPVDALICEQQESFSWLSSDTKNSSKLLNNHYNLLILNKNESSYLLPDNTQKITFTSGSTGSPKGVCLSNEQLLLQAQALADRVGLNQPRHLCLLPLSTLLENVAGIYSTLLAQGEVMLPGLAEIGFQGSSSLSTERFISVITRYTPDSIIVTPQLLLVLISAVELGWKVPESLKFVAVGGARVSPQLLVRAHELNIPVYEGYGLSECASVVSLNTPQNNDQHSCGRPLPHLDISIENDEVVVSGNAMLGYANDPYSWSQPRIHTGDMGYLTEQGNLVITGRRKNLLISSYGRNINPEWVESELLTHPQIAECVVFGDARPYCIALISTRGNIPAQQLAQLIEATNRRLPDYARILNWQQLDSPLSQQKNLLTDNGRPRRAAIFEHYAKLIDSLYPHDLKVENQ